MMSGERLKNSVKLPRVVCKDGFSVSIQGGYGLYSEPRQNVAGLQYTQLELGFPSEADGLIQEYGEFYKENHHPTDAVYPYVPVDVIVRLIERHGGLDEEFRNSPKARKLFDHSSPFLGVWRNLLAGPLYTHWRGRRNRLYHPKTTEEVSDDS